MFFAELGRAPKKQLDFDDEKADAQDAESKSARHENTHAGKDEKVNAFIMSFVSDEPSRTPITDMQTAAYRSYKKPLDNHTATQWLGGGML